MGMLATKVLRSERRWQDQRWTVVLQWGQGSATTCLMMEKRGRTTVDEGAKAHVRAKVEHP